MFSVPRVTKVYVFLYELISKYIMVFVAIIIIFILFGSSIRNFYCYLGFNFISLHLLNPFLAPRVHMLMWLDLFRLEVISLANNNSSTCFSKSLHHFYLGQELQYSENRSAGIKISFFFSCLRHDILKFL